MRTFPSVYQVGFISFMLISASSPLQACEKDIATVLTRVEADIGSGKLKGSEIGIVWDNDGVMTNMAFPDPRKPLFPRKHAIHTVKSLKKKGVNMVISSAWSQFDHTVGRVKKLGLGSVFGLTVDMEKQEANTAGPTEFQWTDQNNETKKIPLISHRLGNVISVSRRDNADPDDGDENGPYYRQKALSPYLSETFGPKIQKGEIKKVYFIDDSGGNIQHFNNDVASLNLFPGAQVETIHLCPPVKVDEDNSESHTAPVSPRAARNCKASDFEYIEKAGEIMTKVKEKCTESTK